MAQRSLNKVQLIGHLGKDPEVRYTSSGKPMATFSLATSLSRRDADGKDQEITDWHRIVAWGRLAEICGEYLAKGRLVYIEGRIQSRDWKDQEGAKRTTVEIVANDLIMLGGSGGQGGKSSGDYNRRPPAGSQPRQGSATSADEPFYPPPEDDIPF